MQLSLRFFDHHEGTTYRASTDRKLAWISAEEGEHECVMHFNEEHVRQIVETFAPWLETIDFLREEVARKVEMDIAQGKIDDARERGEIPTEEDES